MLVVALLASTALGQAARAEEAASSAANAEGRLLDVVLVTARRVSESAQDVPISMTVLDEKTVDTLPSVASNAALARLSPNFSFVDFGGQYTNFANIRGVGSMSVLSPDDTSVPFYVDEIPLSPLSVAPSTLDLARIEVLRGPQGTLYGRNSQGGAVNFNSNRPEFTSSLRLRGEVGTHGWGVGELVANAPIVGDVLAGRLAVRYSSRGGDQRNVVTGGKDGDTQVGSARGSLLFAPDDKTTALLTISYQKMDDTTPLWVLRDADCFPCSGLNPPNDFQRDNTGATLRLERDLGAARLTSVTSYQTYGADMLLDLTDSIHAPRYLALPASAMNDPTENITTTRYAEKLWFQEFRLSSAEESPLLWTLGVNYLHSDYDTSSVADNITSTFFRSYAGRRWIGLKAQSYAAFGEVVAPLTDRLSGTAGLRVTHEERKAIYDFRGGAVGTVPSHHQDASFSDTFVTGRIGLTYRWSHALMTYVTLGRGAVSGGLTTSPRNIIIGRDEPIIPTSTSLTYEAGLKAELWDARASVSAAVFHNDVKKGRLATRDPAGGPAFIISHLDYETYGAEAEAQVRLTPELTAFGGVGYTHARLRNVPVGSPTGGKSGNRLSNVPAWSGKIGAEYRVGAEQIGLGGGQIYANAVYQFVGKRAADLRNSLDLKAYGLVDGRLGWEGRGRGIYLFVNNLTDKRYEAIGASYGPNALAVRPGFGRTVGAGATVGF